MMTVCEVQVEGGQAGNINGKRVVKRNWKSHDVGCSVTAAVKQVTQRQTEGSRIIIRPLEVLQHQFRH